MKTISTNLALQFLILIFTITISYSQSTSWTGTVNTDWNNPSNWSEGVPTTTSDVSISDVANDPVISTADAVAKSIYLNGPLSISASGTLNVDNTSGISLSLTFRGVIQNDGIIQIGVNSSVDSFIAISNQGSITNNGLIIVDRFNYKGVNVLNVNNSSTALPAVFNNNGELKIRSNGVGNYGIIVENSISTFNNSSSGLIEIFGVPTVPIGLGWSGTQDAGAVMNNDGLIKIGSTGTQINQGILVDHGATFNHLSGQIFIDHSSFGVITRRSGSFNNSSELILGETTPVDFRLTSGAFENRAGGILRGDGMISESSLINLGGTIEPGFPIGKYTIIGPTDFSNSTIKIDVNGNNSAGTDYDQIELLNAGSFIGDVILGGELDLNINFIPTNGALITILVANSIAGTFTLINPLPNGWELKYDFPTVGKVSLEYVVEVLDNYVTIQDGNWEDATTWQNGQIPPATIPDGTLVKVNHVVELNSQVTNDGRIEIGFVPASLIVSFSGELTNNSEIEVLSGPVNATTVPSFIYNPIIYNGIINNTGSVIVNAGDDGPQGISRFAGNGTFNNLTGGLLEIHDVAQFSGTVNNESGATIRQFDGVQGQTFGIVNNQGLFDIVGGSFSPRNGATFNNLPSGIIDVSATFFLGFFTGTLNNAGTINIKENVDFYVNGDEDFSNGILNSQDGFIQNEGNLIGLGLIQLSESTLSGAGFIYAQNTPVSPFSAGNGLLNIVGNFQGFGGIGIQLLSNEPQIGYGTIEVIGSTDLTGAILRSGLVNSFQPIVGDEFIVLTASAGITSEFASLDLPTLVNGKFEVVYESNRVLLKVVPNVIAPFEPALAIEGTTYILYGNNLGTLDPLTGAITLIGNTQDYQTGVITSSLGSLTVNSAGEMFALANTFQSANAPIVVQVDPATGKFKTIGQYSLPSAGIKGIAFGPSDVLYGVQWNGIGQDIYTINTTDGSATLLYDNALPTAWYGGLEFNPIDGLFYISQWSPGQIYTLNPTTGESNLVFAGDANEGSLSGDLFFDGEGNLYLTTGNGGAGAALYKVDLTNQTSTKVSNLTNGVKAAVYFGDITPPNNTPATSLNFDGVDDFVDFGNVEATNFGTADFSVEFWMNTTSSPAAGNSDIISKRSICDPSNFWNIKLNQNGTVFYEAIQVGSFTNATSLQSNKIVNDGVWHHIAVTRKGSTISIYVDGQVNASTQAPITNLNNQDPLQIGRGACSDFPFGSYYEGSLDELRIFSVALTDAEIADNFNKENICINENMIAYYDFNQGIDSGNNTEVTTLLDKSGSINGSLTNFTLTGSASNWLASNLELTEFEDITAPILNLQNATLQLDASGFASLSFADIDLGTRDNCTPADQLAFSLSQTQFSCNDLGVVTVDVMVTDEVGLTSSQTISVTVLEPLTPISVSVSSNVQQNAKENIVIFSNAPASLGFKSSVILTAAGVPSSYAGLTYQWYENTSEEGGQFTEILGATSSTLTVQAQGDFTKRYQVSVSSASGCVAESIDDIKVISVEASCGKNDGKKVQVCHLPPGNKGNRTTICVSINALDKLLENSPGSYVGSCDISYRQTPEELLIDNTKPEIEGFKLGRELPVGEFLLYPNPSNQEANIYVELDQSTQVAVRVYDSVGRLVYNSSLQVEGSFNHSIPVESLSSGMYTVQVIAGDMVMTKRLIKK